MPMTSSARLYEVPKDILGSITCAAIANDATTTINLTTVHKVDTPTGLAVAKTGSGSTTWAYQVAALGPQGGISVPCVAVQVASQNATLSASAYNTLTWYQVPGAMAYNVYRSTAGTSPSTTGLIGTLGNDTLTFVDTGIALLGGATIPSADTSSIGNILGVNHIALYNTSSVDIYVMFVGGSIALNATSAAAIANAHLTASVSDATFTKRLVLKAAQWRSYGFTRPKQWICLRAASGTGTCVIEVS